MECHILVIDLHILIGLVSQGEQGGQQHHTEQGVHPDHPSQAQKAAQYPGHHHIDDQVRDHHLQGFQGEQEHQGSQLPVSTQQRRTKTPQLQVRRHRVCGNRSSLGKSLLGFESMVVVKPSAIHSLGCFPKTRLAKGVILYLENVILSDADTARSLSEDYVYHHRTNRGKVDLNYAKCKVPWIWTAEGGNSTRQTPLPGAHPFFYINSSVGTTRGPNCKPWILRGTI